MYYQYPQNLDDISAQVKKDLQESKSKLRRLKTKVVLKTAITTVLLVGGVATTILMPNPVSAALVIASAAVLSGAEGIKHTLKRVKSVGKTKKVIKNQDKTTDEQLFVSKVKKDLEKSEDEPTAPPPALMAYPSLRI